LNLKGLHIVILGAGESGVGAAVLAQKHGAEVLVSDNGAISEKYLEKLDQMGIPYEQGGHTKQSVLEADVLIKSPGIPEHIPLLQMCQEIGKNWIGEIEFAAQLTDAKIIAITGTNGKTTTTSLLYEMMKQDGFSVGLGGNIGRSFAWQVALEPSDWYVLEVSSFQLDNIVDFHPHIAILTNITEDHLDRYQYRMENYIQSKFRITKNQGAEDLFIFCADDQITVDEVLAREMQIKATRVAFGTYLPKDSESGAGLNSEGKIILKIKNEELMTIEELALQGRHNQYNSMAAGLGARFAGVRKQTIRDVLANYEGVEHRLEHVLTIGGIKFINDSKATNVNSTMYALETLQGSVIWIAGGIDKGNDYTQIETLVSGKVRALICLGVDNTKLIEEFGDKVDIVVETSSMQEAVRSAYAVAKKGETVLLSPACASFDLFNDYEDRGHQFKDCIRKL
jgi:UDP-N-acetylmuramoylalanine--D-glutamate ligase